MDEGYKRDPRCDCSGCDVDGCLFDDCPNGEHCSRIGEPCPCQYSRQAKKNSAEPREEDPMNIRQVLVDLKRIEDERRLLDRQRNALGDQDTKNRIAIRDWTRDIAQGALAKVGLRHSTGTGYWSHPDIRQGLSISTEALVVLVELVQNGAVLEHKSEPTMVRASNLACGCQGDNLGDYDKCGALPCGCCTCCPCLLADRLCAPGCGCTCDKDPQMKTEWRIKLFIVRGKSAYRLRTGPDRLSADIISAACIL